MRCLGTSIGIKIRVYTQRVHVRFAENLFMDSEPCRFCLITRTLLSSLALFAILSVIALDLYARM